MLRIIITGRKILNLIKGIKIEPAPQHRSHCTPPHNSREHDERPVPQYASLTNSDKTQTREGLQGPLRQELDPDWAPQSKCGPSGPFVTTTGTRKEPPTSKEPPNPLQWRAGTEKCPQASADPVDPFTNRPNSKRGLFAPHILGQQPSHAPLSPKTNMPTMRPPSLSSETKPEATKGGATSSNKYVLSKRGGDWGQI